MKKYTVIRFRLGGCQIKHVKANSPEEAAFQSGPIFMATQVFKGWVKGLLHQE